MRPWKAVAVAIAGPVALVGVMCAGVMSTYTPAPAPIPPPVVEFGTARPVPLPTPSGTPSAGPSAVAVPEPGPTTVDGFLCKDGTVSHAKHRQGACSHHGGVA